jgi:PAS domain S-box-containing protein/putative nucleotidyltransferase with HDIG domain
MRVLYVEDDPIDADLTRRELSRAEPKIELSIVRSEAETLQCLEQYQNYDLMLTDLRLPDGSGFELLAHVREKGLPLAVVMITGQGDEATAVAMLKAGADDYVVKRQGYLSRLPVVLESALVRYRTEAEKRSRPLKVLYAEQDLKEIELTRQHFNAHAPHIQLDIVRSLDEVLARLPTETSDAEFDALMLDHRLHSLNALDVLKDLRQVRGLELPIVLVTGHGDEEVAAQALRLGASDYVVKSPGYLFQLPGVLENAYHHSQLKREQAALIASEKRFRALIEDSTDGIVLVNVEGKLSYVSPSTQRVSGYEETEWMGKPVFEIVYADDVAKAVAMFTDLLQRPGEEASIELRFRHKSSGWKWAEVTALNSLNEPAVQGIVVHFRDISERKLAEERIHRQVQRLDALRTIDIAINTSMDLRVTLTILVDHVIDQLDADAADIFLFDAASQWLMFSAGQGFRTHIIADKTRVRLGVKFAGLVASERRTIVIESGIEKQSPPEMAEFCAEEGFKSYFGTPLVAKGEVKGVLEIFKRESFQPDDEWISFMETLAGQAAIAIDNAEMFEELQRANVDLTLAYDTTLEGWVRALDLRDKEIEGHTQRVAEMTVLLAREMGMPDSELMHVRRGALLHDIGKIAIADNILHKQDELTEEEWVVMQQHPVCAYELLAPISFLKNALDIPFSHHEKWDGTGYPQGLKGEQIPLAARIFAVIDVWDALSHDRHYRSAWEKGKVLSYIRAMSGSHFDPAVVAKFMLVVNELSTS